MPPTSTQVRLLKKEVPIKYRSTTCVQEVDAKISYDEAWSGIHVKITDSDETTKNQRTYEFIRRTDDVKSVTAENYTDVNTYLWVLFLHQKDGNKDCFQFDRREDRDTWENGVRSLLGSVTVNINEFEKNDADKEFLAPITRISLRKPPKPDVLVSLSMSLGECPEKKVKKRDVFLDVTKENGLTERASKELIENFVKNKKIHPNEKISLFRYVRTMLERVVAEEETEKLVKKIRDCHIDKMLEAKMKHDHSHGDPAHAQGDPSMTFERYRAELDVGAFGKVVEHAATNLTHIEQEIPNKIGKRGTNAQILTLLLKRSIDKMKKINDLRKEAHLFERDTKIEKQSMRHKFCQCDETK